MNRFFIEPNGHLSKALIIYIAAKNGYNICIRFKIFYLIIIAPEPEVLITFVPSEARV